MKNRIVQFCLAYSILATSTYAIGLNQSDLSTIDKIIYQINNGVDVDQEFNKFSIEDWKNPAKQHRFVIQKTLKYIHDNPNKTLEYALNDSIYDLEEIILKTNPYEDVASIIGKDVKDTSEKIISAMELEEKVRPNEINKSYQYDEETPDDETPIDNNIVSSSKRNVYNSNLNNSSVIQRQSNFNYFAEDPKSNNNIDDEDLKDFNDGNIDEDDNLDYYTYNDDEDADNNDYSKNNELKNNEYDDVLDDDEDDKNYLKQYTENDNLNYDASNEDYNKKYNEAKSNNNEDTEYDEFEQDDVDNIDKQYLNRDLNKEYENPNYQSNSQIENDDDFKNNDINYEEKDNPNIGDKSQLGSYNDMTYTLRGINKDLDRANEKYKK